DYVSEYRYRNPVILPETLFLFITQSGETLDTIAAQRQLREHGKSLTITNVVGSMTTRVADAVLYTRAGPEIGVASTKAFTTQLTCLYLVALHLAKLHKTRSDADIRTALTDLTELPQTMDQLLEHARRIADMSKAL